MSSARAARVSADVAHPFSTRDARIGDAAAIARLADAALPERWSVESVRRTLAQPVSRARVVLQQDRVATVLLASRVFDEVEIVALATAGTCRRRGLARGLLGGFLRDEAAAGAAQVTLEVRASNVAALELYRACGFERVGERPRYYRDGETAHVLSLLF